MARRVRRRACVRPSMNRLHCGHVRQRQIRGEQGGGDAAGGDELDAGVRERAGEGLQHVDAAGGLGGKKFEPAAVQSAGRGPLPWGS